MRPGEERAFLDECAALAPAAFTEEEDDCWQEYDRVAQWCAEHGSTGDWAAPMPKKISAGCMAFIDEDRDAFMVRVHDFAYARAMEGKDGSKAA